ncbi:MAG: hypothetical protein ABIR84_04290, partial [Candidatus Nitrotoga sp.]
TIARQLADFAAMSASRRGHDRLCPKLLVPVNDAVHSRVGNPHSSTMRKTPIHIRCNRTTCLRL